MKRWMKTVLVLLMALLAGAAVAEEAEVVDERPWITEMLPVIELSRRD